MPKRHNQKLQLAIALVMMLVITGTFMPAYSASASSEQQAAQVALQQNGGGGKVLNVSTETDNSGRRVFAVKILSNGRVRVIRIPQN